MIVSEKSSRGGQVVHRFENGYGASVISDGYGAREGLYELAVIKWAGENYELTYATPITSDVLGYLSASEVEELLDRIEALTEADVAAERVHRKRAEIAEMQAQIEKLQAEIDAEVAS